MTTDLNMERSKPLRLFTIFFLYAGQGIPLGLFDFAIPAWMAVNGASAQDIGFVVAMVGIPWSFKFVAGLIMDRYTLLAMGRRRIWIIGAQAVMMAFLTVFAVIAPGPRDIVLLGIAALAVNTAVVFQDVAVDGLTVDILPEDERSIGGGLASGGQILGMAASASFTGAMIHAFGISSAYLACALLVAAVTVHIIWTRERAGERRMPWSDGEAQPVNIAAQSRKWLPMLVAALKNSFTSRSMVWFTGLLTSGLTYGICVIAVPLIATGSTGWSEDKLGALNGTAQLMAGIIAISIGGLTIGKIGAQRALWIFRSCFIALIGWMVWSTSSWSDPNILIGFVAGWTLLYAVTGISDVVINMRLSPPTIAATQFSIFMAVSNMGISLAGILVAGFVVLSEPKAMLILLMAVQAVSVIILLIVKFPTKQIGNGVSEASGAKGLAV